MAATRSSCEGDEVPDAGERAERFEKIIVPEVPFVARVSRSMSRSFADAEDLAQETLVKAFRSLDSFDGRYPRAWLFRIARNTAINRSRKHTELVTDDDLLLESAGTSGAGRAGSGGGGDDPESVVVEPVLDDVLQRALDELPPPFRVVVDLVDVEGMRYQEAADLLEVPIGTVMSRLHRARNKLREAVAGTPLDRRRR